MAKQELDEKRDQEYIVWTSIEKRICREQVETRYRSGEVGPGK